MSPSASAKAAVCLKASTERVGGEDTGFPARGRGFSMSSTIRQHAGSGLVAAGVIIAAVCEGLFEPLGYAAASLLVWGTIAVCLIGGVFGPAPIGRLALLAGLLLAAVAALALLSTNWANDQGRAFEEGVRATLYLGLFTLAVCTAGRGSRRDWLAGLTAGLGVVTFIALIAYLQPGTLDSGRSEIPNAAGRLSYPIGYWNGAAALLAVAAVLLADWASRGRSREVRAAATAMIPAVVLAIWLTSSRGGLVALAIGWVVLVAASRDRSRLLKGIAIGAAGGAALVGIAGLMDPLTSGALDSARRTDGDRMSVLVVIATVLVGIVALAADEWVPRIQPSRRVKLALAGLLLVAAVVAVAAIGPAGKIREFTAAPAPDAPAGAVGFGSNGRWQFWESAIDAFASSPVRGLGAGGWEAYWGAHATIPRFTRNPHSLPLQAAAELGVAGIVLLLGFFAVLGKATLRRLRRRRRGDAPVLAAVIVSAAVGAVTDWTWEFPAVIGPAVICAGLLLSSAPPPMGARRAWEGGITLVLACFAMIASALVLAGDIELRLSRAADDRGDFDAAIARARDASAFEPWASAPYVRLALLRESQRDLPLALADLREAVKRDTGDWRLSLIEARLESRNGAAPAARKALKRARAESRFSAGPG
jgi:O-Antigen ligase